MRRSAGSLPARILATAVLLGIFQPSLAALDLDAGAGSSIATLADPLELTPEMKAFVDSRVRRDQPRQVRLLALQDAIFNSKHGLGVEYGSSVTHSAAATFDGASGNCLSFTLLFVALARHLDLDVYFVEVDEVTGWSQRGNLGFSHWHMYAEVELDNGVVAVDFLPWADRRYRSRRRISEPRARAHYFSNVGAEALSAGDPRAAIEHLRHAIELDPEFRPAKVNLAVVYRRAGRVEEAEALLLDVLAVEPDNTVAAANLASLYILEGRRDEAQQWLSRRDAFLRANPFYHFRLGMHALQSGQPAEAREHFKRAIGRHPDEAVFFEQLATAQFQLGSTRKARASLKRALRMTDDPEQRRLIEHRLADPEGAGPPPTESSG